jgi:hypothetical protein
MERALNEIASVKGQASSVMCHVPSWEVTHDRWRVTHAP